MKSTHKFIFVFSLVLIAFSASSAFAQPTSSLADTSPESVSDFLTARRWSPYLVGIGIGLLLWISFLLSNKALGVSTAFVRTCGMLEKTVAGEKVLQKAYYQKYAPKIDWQWMLVFGLFVGAFTSAMTSGDFDWIMVPSTWAASLGDNSWIRWLVALFGGILISVGSRWAGGCTSGHGISGTSQLVVSSWIAVICFFISGIATAMLIYYVIA